MSDGVIIEERESKENLPFWGKNRQRTEEVTRKGSMQNGKKSGLRGDRKSVV